ncbi:hypothetical protein D3C86_1991760 [compost metagenome]
MSESGRLKDPSVTSTATPDSRFRTFPEKVPLIPFLLIDSIFTIKTSSAARVLYKIVPFAV